MRARIPSAALALGLATGSAPAQEVGRAPGQHLFDIELPTIDGSKTLRLSDFRGKKLLLVEFASW